VLQEGGELGTVDAERSSLIFHDALHLPDVVDRLVVLAVDRLDDGFPAVFPALAVGRVPLRSKTRDLIFEIFPLSLDSVRRVLSDVDTNVGPFANLIRRSTGSVDEDFAVFKTKTTFSGQAKDEDAGLVRKNGEGSRVVFISVHQR